MTNTGPCSPGGPAAQAGRIRPPAQIEGRQSCLKWE